MSNTVTLIQDPDDSWAEVELFRWQYGKLPNTTDYDCVLDVSAGLEGMSKAIELACKEPGKGHPMPAPFNVCAVLEYCARRLRK